MFIILFCVNPFASRVFLRLFPLSIKASTGINIETFISNYHGDIIKRVKNACIENTMDTLLVIAVGGDGTLNQVVNGYMSTAASRRRSNVFLSQMAFGTANDFAKSVPIIDIASLKNLLEKLSLDPMYKIPFIKLTCGLLRFSLDDKTCYFCNVASAGISGYLLQSMSENSALLNFLKKSPLKSFVYLIWVFFLGVFKFTSLNTFFCTSINEINESFIFMSISIGKYFGGGICISPMSDPTNFKLVQVQTLSSGVWLKTMSLLLFILLFPICVLLKMFGFVVPLYLVCNEYTVSKKLFISSSHKNIPVECDGELVGTLPVSIEMLPEALPWLSLY